MLTTVPLVPSYDEVIERNKIEALESPADLAIRDGDIAVTPWGDLMLNDADYSAFYKLVQEWRFNYPTLRIMFEAVFHSAATAKALEEQRDAALAPVPGSPFAKDYERFHALNDELGANEVARGAYSGSICVVIGKMLQSFSDDISAHDDEFSAAGFNINGCSFARVIVASANNFRHNDEWQKTRPPTEQQLKSIRILSACLNEPIAPDGLNHRLSRDISPETLELLSGSNFDALERNLFEFANDLLRRRQKRAQSR